MIRQFTVAFSRTVNLGNFESCRLEASVTHDIPPLASDEDRCRAEYDAQADLRRLLEETWNEQAKKIKTKHQVGYESEGMGR